MNARPNFTPVAAAFAVERETEAAEVESWRREIACKASEVRHCRSVEAEAIAKLAEVAAMMTPHIESHRQVLAGISDCIGDLMPMCEEELQEKSRKWWRDVR
jgi:hypothetical protein